MSPALWLPCQPLAPRKSSKLFKLLVEVALTSLTGTTNSELVQRGVVKALFKSLSNFRVHDTVLADMYKFIGPTYVHNSAAAHLVLVLSP